MRLFDRTLSSIRPLDPAAARAARERQDGLVKPVGALGVLEDIGIRLAGLAGQSPPPDPAPAGLAVFAGDHGVHAQGVSPWPQEITAAMVGAFLSGGAVVSALARQHDVRVRVVDVGTATPLRATPGLDSRPVRCGTADLSLTTAMSRDEALQAIETGIDIARSLVDSGCRCLLPGDMGIANSTPSAALIAAFTGRAAGEVTGRGTGIDDPTHRHKVDVVQRALDLHTPDPGDPIGVLAALGGFEHAATVGFLLGAAAARVPVVLDGVLSAAAALVAAALAPHAVDAMIAGHLSVEPGAGIALERLGLRPVLDLGLRLGEGSGAVLAWPIVRSAAKVLTEAALLSELNADAAPVPRRMLVLGGARSGKSATAERMVGSAAAVTYAATGPAPDPADPEWETRVRLHRERRPAHWTTVETRDLSALLEADTSEPLVVDCLGTWLTAVMEDAGLWAEPPGVEAEARVDHAVERLFAAWAAAKRDVIAISNEVGSGVVPATRSGRQFRDRLGLLNARIAAASDEVWLVTAGIPQRLR